MQCRDLHVNAVYNRAARIRQVFDPSYIRQSKQTCSTQSHIKTATNEGTCLGSAAAASRAELRGAARNGPTRWRRTTRAGLSGCENRWLWHRRACGASCRERVGGCCGWMESGLLRAETWVLRSQRRKIDWKEILKGDEHFLLFKLHDINPFFLSRHFPIRLA
jgi:hypothetical protein